MTPSKNSKKNGDELTIKEVASKLDISESTVKKYIKDFDLSIEKGSGSKMQMSQETFEALSEIAKLRANGLSVQEIKELKSQKPSKHILDEIEEEEKPKKEEILISSDVEEIADEKEEDVEEETSLDKVEEVQEGVRRRRGFNYRYVERQISGDSKRVSSLRLRLRNPNLSVQDRSFFEEALERRILFLNGWKHILRWISTK